MTEGYETATPIQIQAIPHILEGRDVLGCAQTGTGKTAAFALPILHRLLANPPVKSTKVRSIRCLVLASTRELALQIGDSFRTYGHFTSLRCAVVHGGVNQNPQVRELRHGVDILVATPGRLLDLTGQGFVDARNVEFLVLDEADRMLDMGFLPAVREVVRGLSQRRQTLLFSATMPGPIAELANSILREPIRVQIEPVRQTTELVEQCVCFVPQKQKIDILATMLGELKVDRALIFTRTKHGADRVAKQLTKSGFATEALHGNKSQNARLRILAGFKSQATRILVATDIAARGIDIEGISHVFNFELPNEPETYVHRIGRTGRAGAEGSAISLCDGTELGQLADIERLIKKKLPIAFEVAGFRQADARTKDEGRGRRQHAQPFQSKSNHARTSQSRTNSSRTDLDAPFSSRGNGKHPLASHSAARPKRRRLVGARKR